MTKRELTTTEEIPLKRTRRQRLQQRANTVPNDLYSNANEQERRQLQNHRHARRAQNAAEPIGKAITKKDRCWQPGAHTREKP